MKIKRKVWLAILSVALLIVGSVTTTLAYLTDTEEAVNTFTVGNVDIALTESDVDNDGDVLANKYHLIPGKTYDKDPTVTVLEKSEESYVRMLVTVHNASAVQAILDASSTDMLADYDDFFGNLNSTQWLYQGSTPNTTDNTVALEYRYYETVSGADGDEQLPALFETLIIPGTLTGTQLQSLGDDFKIVVAAHAIQAYGFEADAANNLTAQDVAWNAFADQVG